MLRTFQSLCDVDFIIIQKEGHKHSEHAISIVPASAMYGGREVFTYTLRSQS